ncbi:putative minor capsid protein [Sporolactobacillus sp. CQH2019]|uniref:putative minor capsid protein n=1 Tax=Sporolactobacillus sp. CQH2019 TaxID=3023512 RepID=UPI002367E7CB|nr:putative minor capsid protein [Sporolactobacillus sp. CQH2019]MDD9147828.1 putative minor capsid protein [Sporolactobacillus sp. CQH2019]
MFIKPIPPIMLPNTVQYVPLISNDRYGNTWDDSHPVTITHVRVDDVSQIRFSNRSETIDFTSMLYIDTYTSNQVVNGVEQDLAIVPKEKDHIIFNGLTYQIDKVIVLQTERGVHHYECQLNRV